MLAGRSTRLSFGSAVTGHDLLVFGVRGLGRAYLALSRRDCDVLMKSAAAHWAGGAAAVSAAEVVVAHAPVEVVLVGSATTRCRRFCGVVHSVRPMSGRCRIDHHLVD